MNVHCGKIEKIEKQNKKRKHLPSAVLSRDNHCLLILFVYL